MYRFTRYGYWGNSDMNLYECGMEDCAPGHTIDERSIRPNDMLHFVYSGKGHVLIGNRAYPLCAGQGFFIPANTPSFYQADEQDPWGYCWMIFGGINATNYLRLSHLSIKTPILACPNPDAYVTLIRKMLPIPNDRNTDAEPLIFSYCYQMFSQLLRDNQHRSVGAMPDYRLETYIEQTIAFLSGNLHRPLTLKEMAANIGLSPNYFSTLFQQYIGNSPQHYLTMLRMRRACALLTESSDNVKDIAIALGYSHLSAFSKAFTKLIGLSPRKYRTLYFEGKLDLTKQFPEKPAFRPQPKVQR